MARRSLASMSVASLVKMRDDISTILNRRVAAMKQGLRSLGEDYAYVGRIAVYGKKNAAKRRVESGRAAKRSAGIVAARPTKKPARKTTKKTTNRAPKKTSKATSRKRRSTRSR